MSSILLERARRFAHLLGVAASENTQPMSCPPSPTTTNDDNQVEERVHPSPAVILLWTADAMELLERSHARHILHNNISPDAVAWEPNTPTKGALVGWGHAIAYDWSTDDGGSHPDQASILQAMRASTNIAQWSPRKQNMKLPQPCDDVFALMLTMLECLGYRHPGVANPQSLHRTDFLNKWMDDWSMLNIDERGALARDHEPSHQDAWTSWWMGILQIVRFGTCKISYRTWARELRSWASCAQHQFSLSWTYVWSDPKIVEREATACSQRWERSIVWVQSVKARLERRPPACASTLAQLNRDMNFTVWMVYDMSRVATIPTATIHQRTAMVDRWLAAFQWDESRDRETDDQEHDSWLTLWRIITEVH
jgi:hypothetical protein